MTRILKKKYIFKFFCCWHLRGWHLRAHFHIQDPEKPRSEPGFMPMVFFYESGSRKILRNRPAAILDWGTLLLVEEQKWSTAKVQPTMLHFPNNRSNQLFLWRKLLPVHEYMYSYQIYFGTTSRSKLVGKNNFLLQLSIVAVLKFYY